MEIKLGNWFKKQFQPRVFREACNSSSGLMIRILRIRYIRAFSPFLALLLLTLLNSPAKALDPSRAITQYIQTSWTTESGLPQNSIHAIAQTSNGYLWLGTEEGLTRFDGVRFTTYNHADTPGLPSNYVQALAAGRDGTLWIGTDTGLAEFGPSSNVASSGRFRTISVTDGLPSNNVTALLEDADGVLWVGTTGGLRYVRDGRVQTGPFAGPVLSASITSIAEGAGRTLWVGTMTGLFQLHDGRILSYTTRNGLPSNAISSLAAAGDGSVWVGTLNGGLFRISEGHVVLAGVRLPTSSIQALLEDGDSLWISFDRHGIGRLKDGKLTVYNSSRGLPSDICTHALFKDSEGNLWIGLLDAGLLQLRMGKFAVFGKPEGLSGNYIGNLLQAQDGSMWIGADITGLNHLLPDGKVEIWDRRNGLPNAAVFALLQTRDGSLWVGYRNGALARIRNRQVSVYRDPASMNVSLNALFEDREGSLWVGFWGTGLTQFEDGHFRHMVGKERISQIAQSRDGALWIATDGDGLQRLHHGVWTRFDTSQGLPSNHMMSVYADNSGDVWTGTASGGLSRIRGDRVVSWTLKEGLRESTVGSIVEDNAGQLWLGGDNGIYRISKQELNEAAEAGSARIHPVQYGTSDGLRSRETLYGSMPSASKGRDGRVWFGTIAGAAAVDPAHLPVDKVAPPTWIENIRFDSRNVPMIDGARIGPGSGNIEATFTAASFVAPNHVYFRYRLIGFDPGWIYSGTRRSAWYTNLPPGHYTFVVQAQNSDGVLNKKGSSFSFVILPPATQTPLAYLFYALLAVLLGWGVVALRTRVLVRRHQELSRIVAERTAQLEAEKTALEAARRELHIQATHDAMTGMYNRAAVLEHLQREISRAQRDGTILGVVVADLDHFKNVNDDYGHLCGDQVIVECAVRFRAALRGYDVLGRIGGEEFLILLPGWDLPKAPERINDLLHAIGNQAFVTDKAELRVTCSFGVATFNPRLDAPEPLELLRRADAALYAAKNSGRNCARFDQLAHESASLLIH